MISLMHHQSKAVQIAREEPRFGFLWEPGAGKTIAILAIVQDAKDKGFGGKTLVLCPKSIMQCAWLQDAHHFPQLRTVVCWSPKPGERLRLIETPGADVLVTNYETFKKHSDDFFRAGVRRLVVDESSKIKAHDTQISKACHRFSDRMESVYILSGTPAPNNGTEYWSQIRCLSHDLFGPSFYQYAFRYFVPVKRRIGDKERIIAWRQIGDGPQYSSGSAWQLVGSAQTDVVHPIKSEFLEKLRSVSWSLKKSECMDLPEQTDVLREVDLSEGERRAYDGMLEQLKVEVEDGTTLRSSVTARAMKLRQITGGGLLMDGALVRLGDSKLIELQSILEELGNRQCVIWAEFTNEINRIAAAVGPDCRIIDGNTPLAARTEAVELFQAGKLQRIVAHPAAAGHGITLTAASHAVYYSHGFSYEAYQQSRDRIHRKGQHSACTYWHLLARGTIDARVLKCLKEKRDAHQAIFEELGIEQVAAA